MQYAAQCRNSKFGALQRRYQARDPWRDYAFHKTPRSKVSGWEYNVYFQVLGRVWKIVSTKEGLVLCRVHRWIVSPREWSRYEGWATGMRMFTESASIWDPRCCSKTTLAIEKVWVRRQMSQSKIWIRNKDHGILWERPCFPQLFRSVKGGKVPVRGEWCPRFKRTV